jgi:transposase-like protein
MALSPTQRRAARYLGMHMTAAETARRTGVWDRTIRRWRKDIPEFAALVESEKAAARDLSPDDVLRELMCDPDPRVRLGAATQLRRTAAGAGAAEADADADVELITEFA